MTDQEKEEALERIGEPAGLLTMAEMMFGWTKESDAKWQAAAAEDWGVDEFGMQKTNFIAVYLFDIGKLLPRQGGSK